MLVCENWLMWVWACLGVKLWKRWLCEGCAHMYSFSHTFWMNEWSLWMWMGDFRVDIVCKLRLSVLTIPTAYIVWKGEF